MSFEEYAKKIAAWLRKNPHNVKTAAKDIVVKKVDENPITSSQIEKLLNHVEKELGDFGKKTEELDITGELTLMDRLRQEIKNALAEREKNEDGNC